MNRTDPARLASRRAELSERALLEPLLTIARTHHVLLDEVIGGSRTKQVVKARHAMFEHLRELEFSLKEIGALLMSDHTTVKSAFSRRAQLRLVG